VLVDHLIYAVPDLAAAVADLEGRFGVRAQAGGKHIGLGTHNALLALGPGPTWRSSPRTPTSPSPPSLVLLESVALPAASWLAGR
jgi:Glyoxalase-like domain